LQKLYRSSIGLPGAQRTHRQQGVILILEQ
jgi:hypothetical protein